ncbi:MAG: hypothetical protein D6767_05360 [Candidatus Hydrogenedentota bacterium]|nr:MAG: hypothetical protein D6767_05360 [Candidatus Hydrogenedentota bacterium]
MPKPRHVLQKKQSPYYRKLKKVVFLVNPSSGRGKGKKIIPSLIRFIEKQKLPYELKVLPSQSLEHLLQLTRENQNADILIAVGGDSTFYFVLNEALKHGFAGKFGFLGAGTSNDIARVTNTLTPSQMIQALLYDSFIPYDLIELSFSGNSVFVAGQWNVGLGAKVNQLASRYYAKEKFWHLPETLWGISAIYKASQENPLQGRLFQGQNVIWEGESSICLCSNIPYWAGGKQFNPVGNPNDGLAEFIIMPKLSFLAAIYRMLKAGSNWYFQKSKTRFFSVDSFTLQLNQETIIQADGEIIGKAKNIQGKIHRCKIQLLALSK